MEGVSAGDCDLLPLQRRAEGVRVHAQKPSRSLHTLVVDVHRLGLVIVLVELWAWVVVLGNIPEVHETRQDLHHCVDVLLAQPHRLECIAEPSEVARVTLLEALHWLSAEHQSIAPATFELKFMQSLVAKPGEHLVETVVRPLSLAMHHNARALQQVGRDPRIDKSTRFVEEHAVVLPKSGGV